MSEDSRVDFQCEHGRHDECTHASLVLGLSDSELDELSDVEPCRCHCHDDCPLSSQETAEGWRSRCTCSGKRRWVELARRMEAKEAGRRQRTTGLLRRLGGRVEQASREQAARAELRRRAQGRSAEELEALIDEVWAGHGLDPPDIVSRSLLLDAVLGPPNRLADGVALADTVLGSRHAISGLTSIVRDRSASGLRDVWQQNADPDVFHVIGTQDAGEVEVELDPDVDLSAFDQGVRLGLRIALANVELRTGEGGSVHVFEHHATSQDGEHLGRIKDRGVIPFRPLVAAAGRVRQRAIAPAVRFTAPSGTQHLYLTRPRQAD
jgi:hypothetical protein